MAPCHIYNQLPLNPVFQLWIWLAPWRKSPKLWNKMSELFCYMHYTPVLLPDFRAPRKDPPIRESPSFKSSTTICLRGIGYRSVWNYKYRNNHQYSPCWNTHVLGMHALHVASFSGPHPAFHLWYNTCSTTASVVLISLRPRPKTNPSPDHFQYLEAIYAPDEVWGRDYILIS